MGSAKSNYMKPRKKRKCFMDELAEGYRTINRQWVAEILFRDDDYAHNRMVAGDKID